MATSSKSNTYGLVLDSPFDIDRFMRTEKDTDELPGLRKLLEQCNANMLSQEIIQVIDLFLTTSASIFISSYKPVYLAFDFLSSILKSDEFDGWLSTLKIDSDTTEKSTIDSIFHLLKNLHWSFVNFYALFEQINVGSLISNSTKKSPEKKITDSLREKYPECDEKPNPQNFKRSITCCHFVDAVYNKLTRLIKSKLKGLKDSPFKDSRFDFIMTVISKFDSVAKKLQIITTAIRESCVNIQAMIKQAMKTLSEKFNTNNKSKAKSYYFLEFTTTTTPPSKKSLSPSFYTDNFTLKLKEAGSKKSKDVESTSGAHGPNLNAENIQLSNPFCEISLSAAAYQLAPNKQEINIDSNTAVNMTTMEDDVTDNSNQSNSFDKIFDNFSSIRGSEVAAVNFEESDEDDEHFEVPLFDKDGNDIVYYESSELDSQSGASELENETNNEYNDYTQQDDDNDSLFFANKKISHKKRNAAEFMHSSVSNQVISIERVDDYDNKEFDACFTARTQRKKRAKCTDNNASNNRDQVIEDDLLPSIKMPIWLNNINNSMMNIKFETLDSTKTAEENLPTFIKYASNEVKNILISQSRLSDVTREYVCLVVKESRENILSNKLKKDNSNNENSDIFLTSKDDMNIRIELAYAFSLVYDNVTKLIFTELEEMGKLEAEKNKEIVSSVKIEDTITATDEANTVGTHSSSLAKRRGRPKTYFYSSDTERNSISVAVSRAITFVANAITEDFNNSYLLMDKISILFKECDVMQIANNMVQRANNAGILDLIELTQNGWTKSTTSESKVPNKTSKPRDNALEKIVREISATPNDKTRNTYVVNFLNSWKKLNNNIELPSNLIKPRKERRSLKIKKSDEEEVTTPPESSISENNRPIIDSTSSASLSKTNKLDTKVDELSCKTNADNLSSELSSSAEKLTSKPLCAYDNNQTTQHDEETSILPHVNYPTANDKTNSEDNIIFDKIIKHVVKTCQYSSLFNESIISINENTAIGSIPFLPELIFGLDEQKNLILKCFPAKLLNRDILITFKCFYEHTKKKQIKDPKTYSSPNFLMASCYKEYYEDFKETVSKLLKFSVTIKDPNKILGKHPSQRVDIKDKKKKKTKLEKTTFKDLYSTIPANGFCAYLATQYLSLRYQAICNGEDHHYTTICKKVWKVENQHDRREFIKCLEDILLKNDSCSVIKQKLPNAIEKLKSSLDNTTIRLEKEHWIGIGVMQNLFREDSSFPFLVFQPTQQETISSSKQTVENLCNRFPFTCYHNNNWFIENEWLNLKLTQYKYCDNNVTMTIESLKNLFIESKNNSIVFDACHFYVFDMLEVDEYLNAIDEAFDSYCTQLFYYLFLLMEIQSVRESIVNIIIPSKNDILSIHAPATIESIKNNLLQLHLKGSLRTLYTPPKKSADVDLSINEQDISSFSSSPRDDNYLSNDNDIVSIVKCFHQRLTNSITKHNKSDVDSLNDDDDPCFQELKLSIEKYLNTSRSSPS